MSDNPEALPPSDNAAFLADKSPGSEWHLTMLMAPYHLNLVVGSDRQALLAWGRDVWRAAFAQQAATPTESGWKLVPVEPTEEMLQAAHAADREYTQRTFGDGMTVQLGGYDHWHAMIAAAPPATPAPAEPVAWLVTGGRMFKDKPFLTKQAADLSAQERKDGAQTVPLYAAPPATPAPAGRCDGCSPSMCDGPQRCRKEWDRTKTAFYGAATPATPAAQPADEREAFEAWVSETGRSHMLSPHQRFPGYAHDWIQSLWTAWQARAALGGQR